MQNGQRQPAHRGGGGDGEDLGPEDVAGDTPVNRLHALNGTDSGDGPGSDVRGGNRKVKPGGEQNGTGRGGFRAETTAGLQAR